MQSKHLEGFGPYIRELRKQKGYTQRDLAPLVNVDYTYLSKVETNSVPPPSDKVIEALAEALDTPKDELFFHATKVAPDIVQDLAHDLEAVKLLRDRQKSKPG